MRPQQRRGGHGRRQRRRAEVGEVEVGGVGDARGGGPERAGHLVGDERRAAERAGALVVLHPAVQAGAVEDVAAVAEPAHLVAASDAAEANGAVPADARLLQLVEPHHGEDLLDDHRRHRPELRPSVLLQQHRRRLMRQRQRAVVVPPLRVAVVVVLLQQRLVVVVPEIQQVAEPHGVERPEEEAADVPQEQEEVEQLLREHQLRVTHRETHACRPRPLVRICWLAFPLGVPRVPLGLRWWWWWWW